MSFPRLRLERGVVIAIATMLVGLSLLSVDWYFVQREYDIERRANDYADNAKYWFTKYPIAVHAELEQGLDRRFALSCLNSTETLFADLFHYNFVEGNVSIIPYDNLYTYSYRSLQPYLSGGDNASMRVGAQKNGRIDLTVRFLSGESPDFVLGVSNWGARMVFLVNGTPDFWMTLHAMLHEFSHTCGLPHDANSIIMNPIVRTGYVEGSLTERRFDAANDADLQKYLAYPSNFTIPGLTVLDHREKDWRTEHQSPDNSTRIDRATTGHLNLTYYFDPGSARWLELGVTHGAVQNLTDPSHPSTTYYVTIDDRRMDLDNYWRLWTRTETQELLGIHNGA